MEFSRKRRIRNVQQVSDIYESEDNVFFTLPCSYVGVCAAKDASVGKAGWYRFRYGVCYADR